MWTEVGFKVNYNVYDAAVLREKRRSGDFHADSMAAAYRFDPDGWVSRQILSTAPTNKETSRFKNARVDKLIAEARTIVDKQKRLHIYAELDSIVNEELPLLYTHHLTLLQAGTPNLKNYQPGVNGAFRLQGSGVRAAWLA
mgnify:FL=1